MRLLQEYGKGNQSSQFLGEYDALPGLSQKADIKKKWYPKMVSDTDVGTIC